MSPNPTGWLLENMIDDFRADAVIDLTWQLAIPIILSIEVGKL